MKKLFAILSLLMVLNGNANGQINPRNLPEKPVFTPGKGPLTPQQLAVQKAEEFAKYVAKRKYPEFPGDREATIELQNVNPLGLEVYLYYSDNEQELATLDDSDHLGRASCLLDPADQNRVTCSFIFPHKHHPFPNSISQQEFITGFTDEERDRRDKKSVDYSRESQNSRNSKAGQRGFRVTDVNPVAYTKKYLHCKWKVSQVLANGTREEVILAGFISRDASGKPVKVESSTDVFKMPRKFVIALLGDSYASGEGAPNVRFGEGDMWDNNKCHRSKYSGHVRAIKKFRVEENTIDMTWVTKASSGARIEELIDTKQPVDRENLEDGYKQDPQLHLLRDWLREKGRSQIDVLLLNIGGNNVDFAEFMEDCMRFSSLECTDRERRTKVVNLIKNLSYSALDTEIRKFNIGRVMISEYPSFSHTNEVNGRQRNLRLCGEDSGEEYGEDWGEWGMAEANLTTETMGWIHEQNMSLNSKIRSEANRLKWTYIGGIQQRGMGRGLCNTSDGYFNTYDQSMAQQDDKYGTAHPNALGFREMYSEPVYNAMAAYLGEIRKAANDARLRKEREDQLKAWRELIAQMQIDQRPNVQIIPNVLKSQLLPAKTASVIKANLKKSKLPARVSDMSPDERPVIEDLRRRFKERKNQQESDPYEDIPGDTGEGNDDAE